MKISRTKKIKFICDTWFDDQIITKEMIYKRFKVTGLCNKLDHSEDYLFSAWKNMEEGASFIEQGNLISIIIRSFSQICSKLSIGK